MLNVTIAIPVYNVEKYIEASLLSALNQSYPNIEYLIIDDKGTDNSMDIVREILKNHPRRSNVRIVEHDKNIGTGATRNSAVDNATGEYLYFMDSDDTIAGDAIRVLIDEVGERDIDVVEASYQKLSNDGKLLEKIELASDFYSGDLAICKWMEARKKYYDGFPWNRLLSLKFLRRYNIRCVPNHRNEDVFFSFQIVLFAKSYIITHSITYNYYMRSGSTVHQKLNEYYYNQYLEIFDRRTDLMKKFELNKKAIVLNNYYLQHFFEWWLTAVLKSDFTTRKKQYFYEHIRDDTLRVVRDNDCLIGFKYKLLFLALRSKNYRPYLFLSNFINILLRIHNGINRRITLFRVYSSWDIL